MKQKSIVLFLSICLFFNLISVKLCAQEKEKLLKNKEVIISKKNAEHYQWGNHCDGWHLVKNDSLSVIQESMPPGTFEQLHYHTKAQQLFYILSGTASFDLNGNNFEIKSGESIHVPMQTSHRISNKSDSILTFLVISSPKAQGDRVNLEEK